MIKPYFEAERICLDENTKEEFTMKSTLLFCHITRVEEPAPNDDTFQNRGLKTVVFLDTGHTPWLLVPYAELVKLWQQWLDAASNIQSVFTNN